MNVETTRDLFEYELRGAYYLETELVEALDRLADEAEIDALDYLPEKEKKRAVGDLFADHSEESERHVQRLEAVFRALDLDPEAREDAVTDGVIRDKELFNNVILNDELRCVYYLRTAKNAELAEISTYEGLLRLAEQLDLDDEVIEDLEANLADERRQLDELETHTAPLVERATAGEGPYP